MSDLKRYDLSEILDSYHLGEDSEEIQRVKKRALEDDASYQSKEIDLETTFQELLATGATSVPNLKIDDRGIKEFPNFYQFCLSPQGLEQRPFAKQLAIATHLLGEWCPRCSHKKFHDIRNVGVGMELEKMNRMVSFLEYGRCTRCGATKSELYNSQELNVYKALVGVAGQRCVTRDTILYTSTGLVEIGDFDAEGKTPWGYSSRYISVCSQYGTRLTSRFFKAKPEPLIRLTTESGYEIKGTRDHPLYVCRDDVFQYIKLGDMRETDEVPIYFNQQVFGPRALKIKVTKDVPKRLGVCTRESQIEYLSEFINQYGKICATGLVIDHSSNWFSCLLLNLGVPNRRTTEKTYVEGNATQALADFELKFDFSGCDAPLYVLGGSRSNWFDRIRVIETIEAEITYDITVPGEHNFIANGILNHNSGKSAFFGLFTPYILHKWLKMPNPVKDMGLLKNSILIGTLTALTFAKAIELLFTPISNALLDSPWFKELFALLDDYEDRTDETLYKVKDTFIDFRYKNLFMSPSGPNKRTLRGATRFLAVTDELGWFPHGEDNDERERASANEVYISLDRSLKTVQSASLKLLRQGKSNVPMGFNMAISSPSSINDKMMTLLRIHEESTTVLCYHFPTWEMNPHMPRSELEDDFRADPVKSERDFGANPPKSENPWLGEFENIRRMFTGKNRVNYQYTKGSLPSGKITRSAKIIGKVAPTTMHGTVLSIDAGYSNNSFAVAVNRTKEITTVGGGTRYGSDTLALVEVAPQRGQNVINHSKLFRELVYYLCDVYNVKLVVADRWNSLKALQDLEEDLGIPTEVYSLVPADFTMYKEMIDDDTCQYFTWPTPEKSWEDIEGVDLENYPHCFKYRPADHLYFQYLTATLDPRGCAQKGQNLTDDLLRANVLGGMFVIDEEVIEEYGLLSSVTAVNEVRALGTKTAGGVTSSAIGVRSR